MKMMKIGKGMALAAAVLLLVGMLSPAALADDWFEAGGGYYTVCDTEGNILFLHAGAVNTDDEYISADNIRYRVAQVDRTSRRGVAVFVEEMQPSLGMGVSQLAAGDVTVAIYCTHTDESYVPTDGVESEEVGGIVDVAFTLGAALEERGMQAVVDDTNHIPHDAGAYRRSRQTAVTLMKENAPDMLIDVHRDGVPAEEYDHSHEGEDMSAVRIVVGRGNQNRAANESFAWTIKSVADAMYPGLIKDIYIGKGSYNQDLMPRAVLLEMGTHTMEKEKVLTSADYVADVIARVLDVPQTTPAPTASSTPAVTAEPRAADRTAPVPTATAKAPAGTLTGTEGGSGGGGAWTSLGWIVGVLAVLGVVFFLFFAREGGGSPGSFLRELTGTDRHKDGR